MTHAWMKMTSGQFLQKDGIQMIGNWLCECCGYQLPYPEVFAQRHVDLQERNASAVGDTIQS